MIDIKNTLPDNIEDFVIFHDKDGISIKHNDVFHMETHQGEDLYLLVRYIPYQLGFAIASVNDGICHEYKLDNPVSQLCDWKRLDWDWLNAESITTGLKRIERIDRVGIFPEYMEKFKPVFKVL